jgi:DNA mismatch repair protein MutS
MTTSTDQQSITLEKETPVQNPESNITPMMAQYLEIKAQHANYLLFYRMGDFYELFFEDAVIASKVLNIALTKRGKHENANIPMCGVPQVSSEQYLHKLIKAGHKVAICEQLETPLEAKKRGSKSVVRREVVRIITAGTITEDNLLEAKEQNYLASIVSSSDNLGIAWVELSTGEFYCSNSNLEDLASDLARINPKELLISDKLYQDDKLTTIFAEYRGRITTQVDSFFNILRNETSIKNFYQVNLIDSFGEFKKSEIAACGSIIEYISITQKSNLPFMPFPKKIANNQFMIIDPATKKNLELLRSLDGKIQGSVLEVLDQTKTNAGSRLLTQYLSAPLVDLKQINQRLDDLSYFYNDSCLKNNTRAILEKFPDIERSLARINLNRGGPRDLLLINNALKQAKSLHLLVIREDSDKLIGFDLLISLMDQALKDEVPLLTRDGGFIREGFNQKIDELVNIDLSSKIKIEKLKEEYRAQTGINNLKIEQNNILGFFIEVTSLNASKMTDNFIFRQNTANYSRYTSPELRAIENDISNAKDIVIKMELAIFEQITSMIYQFTPQILELAKIVASIDVASSLAEVAIKNNYIRPFLDETDSFVIKDGRHIVVESSKKSSLTEEEFIANDCDLSYGQRLWLITGPNMAGKSTFLRQNALIAILAQMGSYVPATKAHIGIIDRVFSRVGAGDDLARGRSTFMVEMVETATILNQASNKSLVILDEIGRGTATYDGLSIACSSLEYLHDKIKCRSLFATHYHELTDLSVKLTAVQSYSMKAKEWQDKIIFLHQIVKGAANRSYGIHVAKLAGIPMEVVKRAEIIMKSLQEHHDDKSLMPLFNKNNGLAKIAKILNQVDLENISNKEAIDLLRDIKTISG